MNAILEETTDSLKGLGTLLASKKKITCDNHEQEYIGSVAEILKANPKSTIYIVINNYQVCPQAMEEQMIEEDVEVASKATRTISYCRSSHASTLIRPSFTSCFHSTGRLTPERVHVNQCDLKNSKKMLQNLWQSVETDRKNSSRSRPMFYYKIPCSISSSEVYNIGSQLSHRFSTNPIRRLPNKRGLPKSLYTQTSVKLMQPDAPENPMFTHSTTITRRELGPTDRYPDEIVLKLLDCVCLGVTFLLAD